MTFEFVLSYEKRIVKFEYLTYVTIHLVRAKKKTFSTIQVKENCRRLVYVWLVYRLKLNKVESLVEKYELAI